MTPTERIANAASTPKTGLFAALRGLLSSKDRCVQIAPISKGVVRLRAAWPLVPSWPALS